MPAPGEGLLIKMWETLTEKAIGSLLKPWQIRREGRALREVRQEDIVILAQAERDAADIHSGRKQIDASGHLWALPEPVVRSVEVVEVRSERALQAATRIASDNLVADAVRKEVNVAKAVLAAEAELEVDARAPSATPIDQDWLFRWRDYAGAVSADELQTLWGRVLAGEVKSPGSFSLRTLEFLKNLSQSEALKIAKLSRFVVEDFIYLGDKDVLAQEGIDFSFLLEMQTLGILSGVESLVMIVTLKTNASSTSFVRALVCHGRVLVITHDDVTREIQLEACSVTLMGREVLKLGTFDAHEGYLRSLGTSIRSKEFRVRLARWEAVSATSGRFFEPEDLSP